MVHIVQWALYTVHIYITKICVYREDQQRRAYERGKNEKGAYRLIWNEQKKEVNKDKRKLKTF